MTEYDVPAGDEAARAHVSVAGLRARGWTPGMVRRLLGEPDLLRPNPAFPAGPRTRLYRLERVEAVERGEEFRAVSAAAARRSAAAKVAAYRRRREVLIRIVAEPIEVPRLTPARLTALAVEHGKRRQEEETREGPEQAADAVDAEGTERAVSPADVEGMDRRTLDRWKVAYLRHQLTRYDALLDGLDGSTGRAGAEALLRRRVYEAIRKTYPDLAEECARRLSEPG
ncbi:hypothetical protein [Streptomyces griseosporeus]|uniref:hypothetical protein n=1 Tax=Streptomyces griseosporeus TaxID=1910 RepID=UPI0036F6E829